MDEKKNMFILFYTIVTTCISILISMNLASIFNNEYFLFSSYVFMFVFISGAYLFVKNFYPDV